MTITKEDFQRYQHQINLAEVGLLGQDKLRQASVLCVGAGGLGTPLLLYLAAAGVGTIGIIDDDMIELSNLHRQIIYTSSDIGKQKTLAAKQRLEELNPTIRIHCYHEKMTEVNASQLINEYDIVADCTDNFATRYLINDTCYQLNKAFVTAAVNQFEGQCALYTGKSGPCLRCLFPDPDHIGANADCETAGVLGVVPGVLALLQATEIIKWILQQGQSLVGRVITINLLKMQFREFALAANPDCTVCRSCRTISSICSSTEGKNNMNQYLISIASLQNALANHEDIQLVDVRTLEKHLAFNIGGLHLPYDELPTRLDELDPLRPVVTYCTSGGRSMMALQYLLSVGFKSVRSLDGGMTAWQEKGC